LSARQTGLLNRTPRLNVSGPVDEDVVRGIVAALPELLYDRFFQGFRGVLDVSVGAQEQCARLYKADQDGKELTSGQSNVLKDLKGCWHITKDSYGRPKGATIYVASDYRAIHNALLPLFAMFYSEYFIDQWIPAYAKLADARSDELSQAEKFVEARAQLAKGMWADIKRTKNAGLTAMYRGFFGLPLELDKAPPKHLQAFGNYVFAEAIDSRYCSPATLQTFKKADFKKVYEAFQPLPPLFGPAWFEK
jgi:hypothetical protein